LSKFVIIISSIHTHILNARATLFAPFQKLAAMHDELPAFRAGYLATVVLIAALLNLGVFAILIAFLMGMDLYKYKCAKGYSWRFAIRGTLRENLVDLVLFALALFATLAFHHGQGIILMSGFWRYQESLIKGVTLTVAKSVLLFRFIRIVRNFPEGALTKQALLRAWNPWEVAGVVALCTMLLLPVSVFLLPPDISHLSATLTDVLVPWNW
jgi:hypothetical protein